MSSDMTSGPQAYSPFDGVASKPSMKSFLFSAQGRIGRGRFWFGALMIVAYSVIAGVLVGVLNMVTGATNADGSFSVDGVAAIPYLVIGLAYFVVTIWSGICLGIKRYHDRDKSGVWILVQLIRRSVGCGTLSRRGACGGLSARTGMGWIRFSEGKAKGLCPLDPHQSQRPWTAHSRGASAPREFGGPGQSPGLTQL